jgi:MscS family membrane protein
MKLLHKYSAHLDVFSNGRATMRSFYRHSRFGVFVLLCLVTVLFAASAMSQSVEAQEADDTQPQGPLRLADTSSPRDTLISFLNGSQELVEAWRRDGGYSDDVYIALRGLQETMDFGLTPYGNSTLEQIRRILMLREILDRIELPPLDDVPGDAEVAEGGLEVWTIPETRIRIRLETEGERAGDYLFSARTTGALDLYYRQVSELPYKPGAQPLLEDWLASRGQEFALVRALGDRLTGIDASSPRSTLEAFLYSVNEAYRIAMDAEAALNESPPAMTMEEARDANDRASDLMRRAGTSFDLSDVPEARRDDAAIEAALLLKEILDRVMLPPIEAVPDGSVVAAEAVYGVPYRWRLPDLSVEIEQILEGDRAGDFLFSKDTVDSLRETYEALKDLPYHGSPGLRGIWEYPSIEPSPGFHDAYVSTPGQFVPSANFLGRLVASLPEALTELHFQQTRWQWIGLILIVLAAWLLCYLGLRIVAMAAGRTRSPYSNWIRVSGPVVSALIVDAALTILVEDINLTGDVLTVVFTSGRIILLLLAGWAVWRACMAFAATVLSTANLSKGRIDASLVHVMAGLAAIITATTLFIAGLRDLGVDAIPLLGGLGVGGLAVALAMRPTLENLISGIILFSDKPVREGDFCSFGSHMGTIENIGVRSVRVRGRDRTIIAIPNAKFADMELINWSKCDRMLIRTTLNLRYETSEDQLRHVLIGIREMLLAHPRLAPSPARARFIGFGESSLNIDLMAHALTSDWNEFHAIREDVYLRTMEIVRTSGTSFAFPSQTIYFGRDSGLDSAATEAAEKEIRALREAGGLPFPYHAQSRIDVLDDTLDYPPRGSVSTPPGQDGAKKGSKS